MSSFYDYEKLLIQSYYVTFAFLWVKHRFVPVSVYQVRKHGLSDQSWFESDIQVLMIFQDFVLILFVGVQWVM